MNDKAEPKDAQPDISTLNSYELVVISAREARRLNEAVRSSNKEMKRRITHVAWERLQEGKVQFTYGEVPIVEEDFEFPELKDEENGDDALLAPDLLPTRPAASKDDEDDAGIEDIDDADLEDEDEDDDENDADIEDLDDAGLEDGDEAEADDDDIEDLDDNDDDLDDDGKGLSS